MILNKLNFSTCPVEKEIYFCNFAPQKNKNSRIQYEFCLNEVLKNCVLFERFFSVFIKIGNTVIFLTENVSAFIFRDVCEWNSANSVV